MNTIPVLLTKEFQLIDGFCLLNQHNAQYIDVILTDNFIFDLLRFSDVFIY